MRNICFRWNHYKIDQQKAQCCKESPVSFHHMNHAHHYKYLIYNSDLVSYDDRLQYIWCSHQGILFYHFHPQNYLVLFLYLNGLTNSRNEFFLKFSAKNIYILVSLPFSARTSHKWTMIHRIKTFLWKYECIVCNLAINLHYPWKHEHTYRAYLHLCYILARGRKKNTWRYFLCNVGDQMYTTTYANNCSRFIHKYMHTLQHPFAL